MTRFRSHRFMLSGSSYHAPTRQARSYTSHGPFQMCRHGKTLAHFTIRTTQYRYFGTGEGISATLISVERKGWFCVVNPLGTTAIVGRERFDWNVESNRVSLRIKCVNTKTPIIVHFPSWWRVMESLNSDDPEILPLEMWRDFGPKPTPKAS